MPGGRGTGGGAYLGGGTLPLEGAICGGGGGGRERLSNVLAGGGGGGARLPVILGGGGRGICEGGGAGNPLGMPSPLILPLAPCPVRLS